MLTIAQTKLQGNFKSVRRKFFLLFYYNFYFIFKCFYFYAITKIHNLIYTQFYELVIILEMFSIPINLIRWFEILNMLNF